MKILVDENMPYARELFSRLGEVKAVPGRPIPVAELDDADALMVRSVTKVNESLLSGKPVQFVGTATAGTDHVDEAWLAQFDNKSVAEQQMMEWQLWLLKNQRQAISKLEELK